MRTLRMIVAGLALFGAIDLATPGSSLAAQIIIQTAPPAPRFERIPPAPGGRFAWIPGRWRWTGNSYVWVGGRYLPMAARYHAWVPGHWAGHAREWYWVPGHWQ
jgi:hypothetical protein